MTHGRYNIDRPQRVYPSEIDYVGAYALMLELTPEEGYDSDTQVAAGRFKACGEVSPEFRTTWEGVTWAIMHFTTLAECRLVSYP